MLSVGVFMVLRWFVGVVLAWLVLACGGRQPRCFECGLTEMWAQAERERELQKQQAHQDKLRAIEELAERGEGAPEHAELMSDLVGEGNPIYLRKPAEQLSNSCARQPPLAIAWTYKMLAEAHVDRSELTDEVFALAVASRGDDAPAAVRGCENTQLAALCQDALARAERRQIRCGAHRPADTQ